MLLQREGTSPRGREKLTEHEPERQSLICRHVRRRTHMDEPLVGRASLERGLAARRPELVRHVPDGRTVPGHLGHEAVEDVVREERALLDLPGRPDAPLALLLRGGSVGRGEVVEAVRLAVEHAAVARPEEAEGAEDLACGADCSVLCPMGW